MPIVTAEILAASVLEKEPSVVLTVDDRRYLFNAGEGTQRFCMEHHVRLGKIKSVFLSGLSSSNTGGLPGILMSVSDMGTSDIEICGPPGTGAFIHATRYFLRRKSLGIQVFEFCPENNQPYDDGVIKIYGVVISAQMNVRAKQDTIGLSGPSSTRLCQRETHARHKRRRLNEKTSLQVPVFPNKNEIGCAGRLKSFSLSSFGNSKEGSVGTGEVVCYICESRNTRGRFLPEKASQLGVPKGPLFGRLSRGENIQLDDGTVVYSEVCKLPDSPGVSFAVISCPSLLYLTQLITNPHFMSYQRPQGTLGRQKNKKLTCLFHLTRRNVFELKEYKLWMASFGEDVKHVVVNSSVFSGNEIPLMATFRQNRMLHEIHPRIFPLISPNESTELKLPSRPEACENLCESIIPARSLLKIKLAPVLNVDEGQPCYLDATSDPVKSRDELLEHENFKLALHALRGAEKDSLKRVLRNEACITFSPSPTITFLGTGCSQPSKYRNVSSIHISCRSGDIF